MNHDVFISYSRKDRDQAEALCRVLAEAGVDYWIDLSEIHGSANFLTEITRNIKACKVLIFIASANSAASKFTQKEILYAIKHNKTILPYKIGEFQFEDNDELDFVFTNVRWVESLEEVVKSLEKQGLTHKAQPQPVEQPTPDPQPQPQPQPQPKPKPQTDPTPTPTPRRWWLWAWIAALVVVVGVLLLGSQPVAKYKVGDLYDDGTKKGVVFEVSFNCKHGKIVSLEEAEKQWAIEAVYRDKTGATSMSDGKANMQKIMAISGWREKYPAFAWCADLGEGWYLPARDELLAISKARYKINATLSANGCTKLNNDWYWSSCEDIDEYCAWGVGMGSGSIYSFIKRSNDYVRAVSAF